MPPASPSPRRPRQAARERRAQIVAAARTQFVQAGFDGTTVRQIAAAADVHDAILYRFFKTKEQLFEEAVAAPLEDAVNRVIAPASGEAGVRASSVAFVADLLEAMREMAPLLLAVLGDAQRGKRFYRERFQPSLTVMAQRIDANLSEWSHRDFDPDLAYRAVFGMCLFISLDWRFGSDDQPPSETLAADLLAIVWDGLRSRPEDH